MPKRRKTPPAPIPDTTQNPAVASRQRMMVFAILTLSLITALVGAGMLGLAQVLFPAAAAEDRKNVFLCKPADDPDMTFILYPNTDFVTFDVPFRTNELGFRDDPIRPKTEGMFRILCVGDSVTFGTGVRNDQTFPNVLEARLKSLTMDRDIDVINAGVSAYNARNIRGLMGRYMGEFKPELVVYTFVENDLDDSLSSGPGGWLMEYDPTQAPDAAFMKGSFAPTWLARYRVANNQMPGLFGRAYENLFGAPVPDVAPPLLLGDHAESRARWDNFKTELTRMRDLARGQGAQFVLYFFATRNHCEPLYLRVEQICRELEVPFASTLPIFDRRTYVAEHSLGYDPHCNPAALVLMADRLQTFLEQVQALPADLLRPATHRASYSESVDPAYAAQLEPNSTLADAEIVPREAQGIISMLGGLDVQGRMARNCIVRVGGSGNAIAVEATALLAQQGQGQTLSARIEGGDPTQPIQLTPSPLRILIPLPPAYHQQVVEIELIAGGPSFIPQPEQRVQGMEPYTVAIQRIARTNQ